MNVPEKPVVQNATQAMVKSAVAPTMAVVPAVAKKAPKPSWAEVMAPGGVVAGVPYNHRVLASASYLSAFGGFWLIVPAAVYLWKGRQDRFLGFHALQAVFLQVAMIPIVFIGLGLAYAIGAAMTLISHNMQPLAGFLALTIAGLAFTIPSAATVWLGMCALRGQPRELPLLGRWANAVVRDV